MTWRRHRVLRYKIYSKPPVKFATVARRTDHTARRIFGQDPLHSDKPEKLDVVNGVDKRFGSYNSLIGSSKFRFDRKTN